MNSSANASIKSDAMASICKSAPVIGSIGRSGVGGGVESSGRMNAEMIDVSEDREERLRTDMRELLLDRMLLLVREEETDDVVILREDELETLLETDELETLLETEDTAPQVVTLIMSESVVTVPPNANARPVQVTLAPTVIPALSMIVPTKIVFAASVVAWVGVQKILQADAPFKATDAPAVEVSAPFDRKI